MGKKLWQPWDGMGRGKELLASGLTYQISPSAVKKSKQNLESAILQAPLDHGQENPLLLMDKKSFFDPS